MLKILPYEHSGNKKAKTMVVLLHGLPDSLRIWDELMIDCKNIDAQYLAISYPNFHKAETSTFGQCHTALADRIKQTVDFVDQGKSSKKIFVTHGVGATLGYLLDEKYPNYMDDMIALDCASRTGEISLLQYVFILTYQFLMASMFLVSFMPLIGNRIGTLVSRITQQIFNSYDAPPSYNASMNYPYVYQMLNLIISLIYRNPNVRYLAKYEPSVPIVFIYGTKKPLMFHSPQFQLQLAKNKDSQYIQTDGSHWVMKHSLPLLAEKIKERVERLQ